MLKIGYMRVSKHNGEQNFNLQRDALISAGVQENRIYSDMASGKNDMRAGLQECMKALQPGNVFVVWKLDRLGRSLKDLVKIIDSLNSKGIGFKVLSGHGADIDTTTPSGKLVFNIFASLAEYERELIRERTTAGLIAARSRGKVGGRPKKISKEKLKIIQSAMRDPNTAVQNLAVTLGVTTPTIYRYVKPNGEITEHGKKILD